MEIRANVWDTKALNHDYLMVKNPLKGLCVQNHTCFFFFFPAMLFGPKISFFTNPVVLLESESLVCAFTDGGS